MTCKSSMRGPQFLSPNLFLSLIPPQSQLILCFSFNKWSNLQPQGLCTCSSHFLSNSSRMFPWFAPWRHSNISSKETPSMTTFKIKISLLVTIYPKSMFCFLFIVPITCLMLYTHSLMKMICHSPQEFKLPNGQSFVWHYLVSLTPRTVPGTAMASYC